MSFPRKSKIIDDTTIKIEQKYLVEKHELILDRLKCVGCGQCSIVCPKDAILFGPAAAVYENKPKDLNAAVVDSIDEDKCVYCGTCVVFCPFDAISLHKNGEKVKVEEMFVVSEHSLPKLESEKVFCENLNREADIYWDGKIEVTYKMHEDKEEFTKYYMNKCPGDCRKCVDICPTKAITFPELEEAWEKKELIVVDDEKCIKCSACMLVCPQDNFKVTWTEVKTSGPFIQMFYGPIEEKLLAQKVVFSEEEKK